MSRRVRQIKNQPGPITLKELLRDEKKRMRLFFLLAGVLLIGAGLITRPHTDTVSKSVSSPNLESFSGEPVKVDKSLLGEADKDKAKSPPIRIVIPALQIDLPVREAKVVDGFWEVFPDSAAFGLGSAYPDEAGNEVIFAHAREGLFLPLRKAKIGQNITVFTKDKWYSYKIKDIKEVLPSQTEVIAPTKDAVLTLYTCNGFSDSKRLIVTAERI